jgi:hypothetical protein
MAYRHLKILFLKGLTTVNLGHKKSKHLGKNPAFLRKTEVQT